MLDPEFFLFMTQNIKLGRIFGALALLTVATGCASTPSTNLFTEAGFASLKAGSPAQQQALSGLAPGKFSVVKHNGKEFYAYADTAIQRLYLGSEAAFKRLRETRASRNAGNEDAAMATTKEESGLVQSAFSDWKGWNFKSP